MTTPSQPPSRWTEARTARLIAMIVSAAVVLADLWLLVAFLRVAGGLPGGWRAFWYIPFGILGILVFAGARFRRNWRLFHAGEEPEAAEEEE
jgi:hypothetical protein